MTDATSVTVAAEPVGGPTAQALLAEYQQEAFDRWNAPPLPGPHPEPADAGLVSPGGVFLVARVGGEPAGCVGVRTLDTGVAEIKRMYVRPGYRGLGFDRRLLAHAEGAA